MERNWHKLDRSFYLQQDVLKVAKGLIGKLLISDFKGKVTAGKIIETEAYNGIVDKASHAYGGKRTQRTGTMYMNGGHGYIYLCYGIHHLFNVVTNVADIPHAVLIRSIEPIFGTELMHNRTSKKITDKTVGTGPGNVSKALGITTSQNGIDLCGDIIYIAVDEYNPEEAPAIIATPRIGVDYAGEDALLPYRFFIEGHPQISAKQQTRNFLCK